jgi:hypothetical protein
MTGAIALKLVDADIGHWKTLSRAESGGMAPDAAALQGVDGTTVS